MNYLNILIPFVGGLGMFIYGMQIMAQGLENAAGNRMKSLLEVLTKNKMMGVLLGAVITAVIQSSSATTVMVVGFVNAGIMNLTQAMGVIMGANIGTTVTGWLVSSVEWAKVLSPSTLAPIAIMVGVVIMLIGKRRSSKEVASIIVGFGLLFVGITTMSSAVAPLQDSEGFRNIFVTLGSNPLLGILAGTLVTADPQIARQFIADAARTHGRIQILNEESAKESTGHGSPLPQLVHGGPGRAGGGEELGGLRAVKHYMQRTAIQGSPSMLAAISKQWVRGAKVEEDRIHPFRKYFEELQPGDSLLTPRRTMTEADIVNFACLSGDHFYAHMDKIAAAESIFGERVVHGYFVLSAAAGLFVDAGVGPVIANYGLESLRFIEPVKPGDTIQVRLTCKRKTLKKQRSAEEKPTGVVEWAVEVFNQHQTPVALYSILTLVARQHGDFVD